MHELVVVLMHRRARLRGRISLKIRVRCMSNTADNTLLTELVASSSANPSDKVTKSGRESEDECGASEEKGIVV